MVFLARIYKKEYQKSEYEKRLELPYREAARECITRRADYYCRILGVTYQRIAIRDQKTRWGSCSSNQTLSFNWRLILAPPKVLEYVVLHEVCHLQQMNHSKAFWSLVCEQMPDYKIWQKWLNENGNLLTL